MKKTIRTFLRYLGNHTFALLFVGVLVIVSAGANLYGTYLLNPIIDNYILPHDYYSAFCASDSCLFVAQTTRNCVIEKLRIDDDKK